jgi:hypothetical protein
MRAEIIDQLRDANDLQSLMRGVLALCEPYGPVHSFKLVHNRGAARVVCFVELESPKQQPMLARALGAKTINGAACLDIPVGEDFGGDRLPGMPAPMREVDGTLARVTN